MNALELSQCTGARLDRAIAFLQPLQDAMQEYEISTPERQSSFLAQIGHESGGLRWLTELWGPTPAQTRYEGRIDLGNMLAGDGFKYRGRGLIQLTGRANYQFASDALDIDLIADPGKLSEPVLASLSAAWFWKSHGLNELADGGNFMAVTRRINGGTNGYADRLALFETATSVLG